MDRLCFLIPWCVALSVLGAPSLTHADSRHFAVHAVAGSGVSFGGGGDSVVMVHTPVFADVGLITWDEYEPGWFVGASLRMEMEGRVSVGGSVRAGLLASFGPLIFRPNLGIAMYFAPFTMFGFEGGTDIAITVFESLRVLVQTTLNAYFTGDDIPSGSAVIMCNGTVGIEVGL